MITITVDVDGRDVTRVYDDQPYSSEAWGERIIDMVETIKQAEEEITTSHAKD